jgi:hypothetical protein
MTQGLLWQDNQQSPHFAELCNALYERELRLLAHMPVEHGRFVQAKLKSLPHYVKRTAYSMLQAQSPLILDLQNASWSAKQSAHMPLVGQTWQSIQHWYLSTELTLGLVVPVLMQGRIRLDCIDRLDHKQARIRTNAFNWFELEQEPSADGTEFQLLKPTKKVMMAACAGHSWRATQKQQPITLTLRELLLSCQINWQNFKHCAVTAV